MRRAQGRLQEHHHRPDGPTSAPTSWWAPTRRTRTARRPTATSPPRVKTAVMDVVAASYPPEFLNRIDSFIVFKRLAPAALRDIVDIRVRELAQRLADRRVALDVPPDVRDWLASRGYDPRFGARPLNRLITSEIGNGLAANIISGEIKMGDTATVAVRTDGSGLEVRAQAKREEGA